MLRNLLLDFFVAPACFVNNASGMQWTIFLQQAREQGLSARFFYTLQKLDLLAAVPEQVQNHGQSAAIYAEKQQHSLYFELRQLEPVFVAAKFPCLLLKGAAYRALSLQVSHGRLFSDLDILVPAAQLKGVRNKLFFSGFSEGELSDYDRHYYLQWSHQNPPLYHVSRHTVIDLHHHIYPTASAKHINIQPLFIHAESIPGSAFRVPTVAHLFIHAAVHLFYQEETHKLIKDIVDLNDLFSEVAEKQQLDFLLQQSVIMGVQSAVVNVCYILAEVFDNQHARYCLQQSAIKPQMLACRLMLLMLKPDGRLAYFALPCWYLRGHFLKMRWNILLYHIVAKPVAALLRILKSNNVKNGS